MSRDSSPAAEKLTPRETEVAETRQVSSAPRRRVTPASLAATLKRPLDLFILCLIALVVIVEVAWQLPGRAARWDFSIYYVEATLLHEGRNPYTVPLEIAGQKLGLETGEIRNGTDPPTFILCMEPLALLKERTAFYLWVSLSTLLLAVSLIILLGQRSGLGLRSALALAALAIIYPPVIWHYYDAQSKIMILFLLVVMIKLMEQGRDRAAGVILAVAGLLRVFPLLLIGYLAIQRRWRQLLWTFAGLLIGGVLTVWLFGVGRSVSYAYSLLMMSGLRLPWMSAVPANIALAAAVSRLFWFVGGHNLGPVLDLVRRITMILAGAVLLGLTIGATLRLKGADPNWRALGMWIIASVLLSPSAWVYYMVLFLIPFAQLAAARAVSERAQWAAALSYAVMLISNIFLVLVLAFIYSHYGRELTRWLMSLMVEGWFAAAMLAYLAAYWFTIDLSEPAKTGSEISRTGVPACH